jgi:hypothetical protein
MILLQKEFKMASQQHPSQEWPGPGFTCLMSELAERAPGNAYVLSEEFDWYREVGRPSHSKVAFIGWNYPKQGQGAGVYTVGILDNEGATYRNVVGGIERLDEAEVLADRESKNLHHMTVWDTPAYKAAYDKYIRPRLAAKYARKNRAAKTFQINFYALEGPDGDFQVEHRTAESMEELLATLAAEGEDLDMIHVEEIAPVVDRQPYPARKNRAGRRTVGGVQKPGRLPPLPVGDTELMQMSSAQLAQLATPAALAELHRRGRSPSGVKLAWLK